MVFVGCREGLCTSQHGASPGKAVEPSRRWTNGSGEKRLKAYRTPS